MKTIERTELIDRYLLGKATAEEKMQVERLLSAPELSLEDRDKFRKEMELQQEIILAVQKQGLKEMLQQADEKDEKAEDKEHKTHIRRLIGWTSGSITTLAAAAVVVFMIVLAPMRTIFYNSTLQYAESLQNISQTRGDEPDGLSHQLMMAQMFILEDNWKEADKLAKSIMQETEQSTDVEQRRLYDEAEWLHVQYLMHQKHVLSAKRRVEKIASGNGIYREQAAMVLEQIQK